MAPKAVVSLLLNLQKASKAICITFIQPIFLLCSKLGADKGTPEAILSQTSLSKGL